MSDLTPAEAAAKYRSLEYRGLGNWYTPDGELLDQEDVTKLRVILAEAYLEQNPADDEESLSEAFVRTIGFTEHPYRMALPTQNRLATELHLRNDGVYWVATLVQADRTNASLDDLDADEIDRVMFKITTRRDLRCLLRGIGHDRKGN